MKESVSVGDLLEKRSMSKQEESPLDQKIGEIKSEVEDVLGFKCSGLGTKIVLESSVALSGVPTNDQLAHIKENLRFKNNLDVVLVTHVENEHVVIVVEKCLRMIYPNMNLNMS